MFAYCNNNASNCSDSFGMRPVSILERFGDIAIPAPPLKVKTTKRDVTAEINSALNTKRMDAVHQRIANDLLFDMGYPQIGGLGGIVIELVEDAPLYIAYYNAVNHEEEWDIKRKDPWEKTIGTSYPGFGTEVLYEGNILTPEDLGNYTYGSIGKAYGFPLLILYAGSYYAAGFPVGEDFWNNEWKDWGYITKGYFG